MPQRHRLLEHLGLRRVAKVPEREQLIDPQLAKELAREQRGVGVREPQRLEHRLLLCDVDVKTLARLEVAPNRKLGPALAKRVKQLC